MSRAARINFNKPMAKQPGPNGIRVNGVASGSIWTPLRAAGRATMEKLQQFGGRTPIGRLDHPLELAPIYVQLAEPPASYSTGQIYGAARGSGQPWGPIQFI